ncbi:MAG TPA: nucleotide exchange factor GrpE [Acidimicrobiaceae bacterium]|nr:nucleotide exchange factor GrpE [Acidimicrobiaceae bacterium]
MSDETNDAAAVDVEDGAAEALADTAAAGVPVTVEDLVAALEAVTAERDQHLADLQRVSAEFQNFRKQTEKRNSDFAAQAGSRVAEALMPVLDACDAAAQQGVEGVEPIAGQLRGELERAGLQVIGEVDAPFDPNLHEAAMSEPGDDGQDGPIVVQVLRTGYAWNGRVLRAAMVKVKG